MVLIISLILALLFTLGCGKVIKKHSTVFYIISIVISIGTVALSFLETRALPPFINNYVLSIFTKSGFASSLWIIVMWAGALKNGSWLIKKIMPIRGELSIIAAILTLGHNIGYGKTYFVRIFSAPESLQLNYILAAVMSLVMMVIMIPLTIISFPKVRKRINGKTWKKIQRTAYIFYALIYCHTMALYIPMAQRGNNLEASLNVILYSIVFISYMVCRIRKYVMLKKRPENQTLTNLISTVAILLFVVCISIFSYPLKANDNILEVNNSKLNNKTNSPTEISTANLITEKNSEVPTEKNTTKATEKSTEKKKEKSTSKPKEKSTEISTQNTTNNISNEIVVTENVENQNNTQSENPQQNENINNNENTNVETNVNTNVNPSIENNLNNNQVNIPVQPEPTQPNYIYNNGTYTAKSYGYDGDIEITITIENDLITNITGSSQESDNWYFDNAKCKVFNEILNQQQADVDACSGATFSSNAIMSAVKSALNMARK